MTDGQDKSNPLPPTGAFVTQAQTGEGIAQSVDLSLPTDVSQHPSAPALPGYVLTQRLGEGAYGQVWRAWQLRTRKEVAVKVFIRRTGLDWLFLQREVERLTRLDKHAHMVTLLDATLDGDPPFYAMDLLERGSLAAFVDPKNPLPTDRALSWMHQIAEALAYVHGRGLIHCDLKPANILVDDQDSLRLVDFGHSRVFTETSSAVGTLFYMAPEQATLAQPGKPAQPDVRWDIYALGATIHALLTGAPPHATADHMAELDQDNDLAQRLSHYRSLVARETLPFDYRHPPAGVDREFWAIVCKCLERDPARRYTTATDLLKDLRALEHRRPVSPLAADRLYRLRKFVQRNPVQVALAAVILISAFSFTWAVWSLAGREAEQRRVAEAERDRAIQAEQEAETITGFLKDMVTSADPMEALGREVTVREVLDAAASKLPVQFQDQPLVEAALRAAVGRTYRSLGRQSEAETHLRAALDLRQKELPAENVDVAESLLDLAALLQDKAEYEQAESACKQALTIYRAQLGSQDLRVASALEQLAILYQDRGETESAEPLLREALEIRGKIFGTQHAEFATGLEHLGLQMLNKGDFAEAERLLRQVVDVRKSVLSPNDPLLADSLDNLGSVLQTSGKFNEIEELYAGALRIRKTVFGADHHLVAQSLNNLSVLLQYLDDLERAESYGREALRILRAARGDANPDVASIQVNIATILLAKEQFAEAEEFLRRSLEVYDTVYGPEHDQRAFVLMHLATAREAQDDPTGAEQLYREAVDILNKTIGPHRPQTATVLTNLGELLCNTGKTEDGITLLEQSLSAMELALGPSQWRTAEIRGTLGACLAQAKRYAEAEQVLSVAYAALSAELGKEHKRTRQAASQLSKLYSDWGKTSEAESWSLLAQQPNVGP